MSNSRSTTSKADFQQLPLWQIGAIVVTVAVSTATGTFAVGSHLIEGLKTTLIETNNGTNRRIDDLRTALDKRLDELKTDLGKKIDEGTAEVKDLSKSFNQLDKQVARLEKPGLLDAVRTNVPQEIDNIEYFLAGKFSVSKTGAKIVASKLATFGFDVDTSPEAELLGRAKFAEILPSLPAPAKAFAVIRSSDKKLLLLMQAGAFDTVNAGPNYAQARKWDASGWLPMDPFAANQYSFYTFPLTSN